MKLHLPHRLWLIVIVFTLINCTRSSKDELILVEPKAEDDFQFPYLLYIPETLVENEKVYLIIEPNNTGFTDDAFDKHMESAKRLALNDFYLGNFLANSLNYPLLVPVFPRADSNMLVYTHALDRDAMLQKDNTIERLDLQLLAMFEDAKKQLANKGIQCKQQFILTGFSASGTFANRFTLIHPEKVQVVAAGGVNGILMLPLDSLNNEAINYPIGTHDLKVLTDNTFNMEAFKSTPQLYFMGDQDNNDAVPYDDAYYITERKQIYRLLGEKMQPNRWDRCARIYDSLAINATIKTYKGIGHAHPEHIKQDMLSFIRSNL